METIAPVSGAISTYGLYAICTILLVAIIYLFKQQKELENTLRENLKKYAEDNATYASENARLLEKTTEAFKDNAQAFNDFQNALSELKQTVQLALERMK